MKSEIVTPAMIAEARLTESDLEYIRNCDSFAQQSGYAEHLTAERQRGNLLRELDATRARLAESAEDLASARESLALSDKGTLALRARLAAVEGERDAVVSAVCAFSEQVAQLQGESVSADDVMRWLDAHLHPTAALSPTQPTPTEGNES